jgi:hypothetical protein
MVMPNGGEKWIPRGRNLKNIDAAVYLASYLKVCFEKEVVLFVGNDVCAIKEYP